MRTPQSLTKGDTIAIAAPARKISREELQFSIKIIEERGYKVRVDEAVFNSFNQFSGTDDERINHFQSLLDDNNVKAILCARGGYGVMRIIDHLNFTKFIENPKWIIGYSDATVLHCHLHQKLQVESLHASMPINFENNTSAALQSLFNAIHGKSLNFLIEPHPLNCNGLCQGLLVGGNLSILYSLAG
ncbi:MAG: LD-carboxypeptidase, partial [Ignavibacteria bacterium]|nr:LD-carboxypeptidase [Ignavibacteria bacterium]